MKRIWGVEQSRGVRGLGGVAMVSKQCSRNDGCVVDYVLEIVILKREI